MRAGTTLKAPGVAALAAAALALALAGAPDAVAQDRCTVPGARTVVASGDSRVFSVAIKRGRYYYGCLKGQRPVVLTKDFSPADAEETTTTNTMFRIWRHRPSETPSRSHASWSANRPWLRSPGSRGSAASR